MTQRKSKQPSTKNKSDTKEGARVDAFHIWLNRGLHQLYDDVAQEPVPSELLRLIEEDRSK